jgi:histidinol-phosphate/aromatic aminotransferase/cobyric acid decarboxylase-like protein
MSNWVYVESKSLNELLEIHFSFIISTIRSDEVVSRVLLPPKVPASSSRSEDEFFDLKHGVREEEVVVVVDEAFVGSGSKKGSSRV